MSFRGRLTTAIGTVAAAAMIVAPSAGADTPGHYIVTDSGTTPDTLYSFTPAGARTTITSGGNLTFIEGVARLGSDDYLVADKEVTGGALDGQVIRVRGGVQSVLANGGNLLDPHGIAISNDRRFAYTAGRDGRVVEITIATGAQRLIAGPGGNLTDLRGIAVERSGSLLVVNAIVPAGRLVRINPASGAQTVLLASPPLADPRAVMVRPNGDLVIGDQGGPGDGFLLGVDLPAVASSVLSGGAFYADTSVPGALALDTSGRIIGADRNTGGGNTNGRIFAVSSGGVPSDIVPATSALLSEPSGLAIVPPKCAGKFATIVGTPGKDKLPGTNGPDVIVALGGKDTLKGKGGKDFLCGGGGKDKLVGGGGKKPDTCIGGGGKDTAKGCEKVKKVP